jgi:hypothetical protein
MDIWYLKNALLTNKRQKVTIAVIMAVANQLQKFKDHILLEEVGEIHLRKK